MRRKGRINQNGHTSSLTDARAGFGGEKLDVVSVLPELFSQAEELSSRGKWQEAAQTCRRGLAFQPGNLTGLMLLGTALWKIGEVEEAEQTLTLARKELEKHALVYSTLAEISQHKGDSEHAEKMLGLHRALLQTDADQEFPPPSENASVADAVSLTPVRPVLERLNLLADVFKRRPFVSRSNTSFFTDNERWILKRILQNG